MKRLSKYRVGLYGLMFSVLSFVACEKVIEVPLNEAEQKLVVEAVLKDQIDQSYILVSKTSSVYETKDFEQITDATVVVSDNQGLTYEFQPDSLQDGKYILPGFKVEPFRVYYLEVIADGETITAEAISNGYPKIDSMTFEQNIFTFGGETDTLNLVSYHAVDEVSETNFYRLFIYVNGELQPFYYLGDDTFINGQYYEAPFFGSEVHKGDHVFIEMRSMDNKMYDYYYSLANTTDQSAFSAAPANPKTNLKGDALGYFGVFMTDTMSMWIPQ